MDHVGYLDGLTSTDAETGPVALPVAGALPDWLAGVLVRNGPAVFDTARGGFRHWFDGQAMLHRFAFADGRVEYRNRMLDTRGLRSARAGRIDYGEFATDPCRAIFGRYFTRFRRHFSGNANVNVTWQDGEPVALTEIPIAIAFDERTLATVGVRGPAADGLRGQITTAHPHQAPRTGDLVNYLLRFGPRSEYQIYRQAADGTRDLIATVPTTAPSYVHSFGITEDHVVLALFPYVVRPLSFLLRDRPFIANYRWRPESGTRFVVIGLADGAVRTFDADPFFAFHHINSYVADGELVVDTSAYTDAGAVDAFYLDRLRAGDPIPVPYPTRHRIDLDRGTVRSRRLADIPLELPRIHYDGHNGRPYRYAYGVGARPDGRDFFDRLVKLDVDTGATETWQRPGTYPGEPVFVPAPDTTAEDDGVVLSVVLDAAARTSFLLVLDARSWREVARATVPHVVPFGFHGRFTRQRTQE